MTKREKHGLNKGAKVKKDSRRISGDVNCKISGKGVTVVPSRSTGKGDKK